MIDYGKKNGTLGKFGADKMSQIRDGEPTEKAVSGKINYGSKTSPLGKFGSDSAANQTVGFSKGPDHDKKPPNIGQTNKKLNKFGV